MRVLAGLSKTSRELLSEVLRNARDAITIEQASVSLGVSRKEAARKLAQWARQGC